MHYSLINFIDLNAPLSEVTLTIYTPAAWFSIESVCVFIISSTKTNLPDISWTSTLTLLSVVIVNKPLVGLG